MTDHLTLATPPAPDRCCPGGACDYRPEMVAFYLGVIRALAAEGADASQSAAEASLGRNREGGAQSAPGGSGICHGAVRFWDVEQAAKALGPFAAVEMISARLCPFALDADTHHGS